MVSYGDKPSRADLAVRANDVCMARMQATTKVKEFSSGEDNLILSTGFAVFRPDATALLSRFLFHWLKSPQLQAWKDRLASGATQKAITNSGLEKLQIPLPGLPEQCRIAAILDKADGLIAQRQCTIALLNELAQALFYVMFGNPVTNEKGWEVVTLGQLGRITTGNTPSRSDPSNFGDAIDWIKPDKLAGPAWVAESADERLSKAGKARARIVGPGSVLVTCIAGSKGSIGNCKLVQSEVAFNQQINAIEPYGIDSWFLLFLLRALKPVVENASTDDMTRLLNKTKFSQLVAFRPPVPLTQHFGTLVDAIYTQASGQEKSREIFDSLLAATQAHVFGGRVD